jgi:hypothetical protein
VSKDHSRFVDQLPSDYDDFGPSLAYEGYIAKGDGAVHLLGANKGESMQYHHRCRQRLFFLALGRGE